MKPKLLITTSTLPNDEQDPEPRFVLDLALGLSRHFEVCVLAPRNSGVGAAATIGDVEIRRYPYAPKSWENLTYPGAVLDRLQQKPIRWGLVPLFLAGLYRETRRLLAERNFACVHANWLVPQGFVQSIASSDRSRVPYIAIARGADVYAMTGVLGSAILRRAVLRAGGVVGVSDHLVETLRRKFPSEMLARPTATIASGVDTKRFSPALRSEDWTPFRGLARPVILCVGRLSEKKGIEFLLTAMVMEPLVSVGASLLIIGTGPLEDRLKQIARRLQLGNRIRFLPACGHADLAQHMAAADVLCLPSVISRNGDQEGRPTVLVEAAACGIPAVASDVGGVREWISEGHDGAIVPPADSSALAHALANLLRHPERLRRMGQAARLKALRTSWSAVADLYAEFTFDVISRTKEGASVRHQSLL